MTGEIDSTPSFCGVHAGVEAQCMVFCSSVAPVLTAQSATNLTALLCRNPGRMVVVGPLGPSHLASAYFKF